MTKKEFRLRLIYVYSVLAVTFVVYVVTKTYTYQLYLDQKQMNQIITETQQQLDHTNVRINTLNSREAIGEKFPTLEPRDNVFFLEEIDGQ